MKRAAVVALLMLALAAGLAPALVGVAIERWDGRLAARAAGADSGMHVVAHRFDRGWLESSSAIELLADDVRLLDVARAATGDDTLTAQPTLLVETRFRHGPRWRRHDGELRTAIAVGTSTLTLKAGDNHELAVPGEILTLLWPGERATTIYTSDTGERHLGDNRSTMVWSPSRLTAEFDRRGRTFSAKGNLGRYALTTDAARFAVGPLRIATEQRQTSAGFWTGESAIEVNEILIVSPVAGEFGLSDARLHTRSSDEAGLLSYHVSGTGARLIVPGWEIAPAKFSAEASNLAADALASLLRSMREQAQSGHDAGGSYERLGELLAAGPQVSVERFELATDDGDLNATAGASLPTRTDGLQAPLLESLFRLRAHADLSIAHGIVDRLTAADPAFATRLQELIAAGMVIVGDDAYEVRGRLEGGLLTINGVPAPLPIGF